jgi:DNA-binding response OmpR family regulator
VANLRISSTSRQAWRGNHEIDLTSKEFALLRLLMHHPGVTLSRAQIHERVWGYYHDPASNVVDQYVFYLRRKIDKQLRVNQLITVRGKGYQLSASPNPQ